MADLLKQIIDNSAQVLDEFQKKVQNGAESIGSTAEKHAKANCPVDTGRLRNSITYQAVANDGIYIGTNVEYGKYAES